jgi:hypothetical protein
MKKIYFLLLFIPLFSISQEYSEIVQVEGKNADQLYSSAREWFALTFSSANDVLQMDDPVAGKLIAKGVKQVDYTGVELPTYMNMFFTLMVEIKDGRYKQTITVTDIKDRAGTSYSNALLIALTSEEGVKMYYEKLGMTPRMIQKVDIPKIVEANKKFNKEIDIQLKNILAELKTAMVQSETDDW